MVTHVPAIVVGTVVNGTGAGDCLVAGTAAAFLSGRDLVASVCVGMRAGAISVQSADSVPVELTAQYLGL
jgi:ribokinase